ncbi:hypothetical protein [Flavobacterium microcysteis]|uniref:Uncharacterized protein n=1 Tax=Flavobacterium microcysteis TaxID=2596891 RepID=A0A501Q3F0_9FLAO|nr:hypothetical protein [Flavobacterium microcysteis]TPD66862.1 hypothetical protein FJA49_11280 [Flavobacterium microcysteis]
MKKIYLLFSLITINSISAQNIETINIPKGVVYNYVDNNLNDKAKQLIIKNLEKNKYSILEEHLIVGPELWKRFQKIEKLQKIKGNITFVVDDLKLSGKYSPTLNDTKLIWDEFKKEITGNYKIRKANEHELKYYWSVISFDIDEPLLIVETENHNYILNFLKSNLKLLWLDEAPKLEYHNPIDNKTYTSEGGFKSYRNGQEITSTPMGTKETALEKVVLLSSDLEFKENSSVEDVGLIIDQTKTIFEELFKNSDESGKIMIQFELKKDNNEIEFAVKDAIDMTIMKEFEKKINNTKFPNSKKDPIKLQLIFKVNSFND